MPKCKNDPKRTYKGTEPTPKGLGYCAHSEKVGKKMKGKDGNQWIITETKKGIKRWSKIKTSKHIKSNNTTKSYNTKSDNTNKSLKINKLLIKIPKYKLPDKELLKNYLTDINLNDFTEIIKFLKLKNNYTIDNIIKKLTSKTLHNKIIKKLINYKKIPLSILDYYLKRIDNVKKEDIINKLLEYLEIQYYKKSLFDFDISFIIIHNNYKTLNEEGPRDYVLDSLKPKKFFFFNYNILK